MNKKISIIIITMSFVALQGMISENFISQILHYDCSALQCDADRLTRDELTQRLRMLESKKYYLDTAVNILKVAVSISAIKLFEEPKIIKNLINSGYSDLASTLAVCTGYYIYSRSKVIDNVESYLLGLINRQSIDEHLPQVTRFRPVKILQCSKQKSGRQN
ncbi:MAG: hypothetical protein K2X90_01575 [Candidatus Babeliaceae bacterium]|nr:hypothetical protein [Candidatus Babeliaceae bacterium]